MKREFFGLLILLALIIAVSWKSASNEIKVGMIYTEDLEETVNLVIETAERYLERDFSFTIVKKTVGFEKEALEQAVRELHNEGVKLIFGPFSSTQAQHILSLFEKFHILAVSPTVTSPAVLGVTPYLISLSMSDDIQAREIAKTAMESAGDVLMILDERNYVYTKNFAANFISVYKIGNVYTATIDSGLVPQKILEICERFRPNVLVLVCDFNQASRVVKTFEENGFTFKSILGSDMVSYGTYSIDDHPWMKPVRVFVHYDVESVDRFVDTHPALAPLLKHQSMTFINSLDTLLLIEKLINTWGNNPDIIIENLPDLSYNGIGGEMRFSKDFQVQRKASMIPLGR